ncbi:MAG: hypothetical protein CMJ31_02180 [Phycisphaerae bacterium]|nr:hypothetical protein [Phycisphaerae bacterium]
MFSAPDGTTRVFTRRRWTATLDLIFSPLRAFAMFCVMLPLTFPLILLGGLWLSTVIRDGWIAAGVAIGAVLVPTWLVDTALTVFSLRDRVEIDLAEGMMRADGLLWFEPWWRPRLGGFECPLAAVLAAELRMKFRLPGIQSVRVVTARGLIKLPGHLRGIRELHRALATIAARNPSPPEIHTIAGTRRTVVLIVAALYAATLAWVVLVFVPSVLG